MDWVGSALGGFMICGLGIALAFGAGRLIAFLVAAN
jgi:hypothetical protein